MRFPTLVRHGSERPIVAVRIEAANGKWILFDSLVDMGSDLTLFPLTVADQLGIDLSNVPDSLVRSVLGAQITYRPATVFLELRRLPDVFRWRPTVGFPACPMNYGILGTHGFFEFFDVRYSLREHWLDIEPAGPLPL